MNKCIFLIIFCWAGISFSSFGSDMLSKHTASKLALMPLKCLQQEFPNKTGHSADDATDAILLPNQLHPSFYGCFDWHSSVHGHWMLVKLLSLYPELPERQLIEYTFEKSFNANNIFLETEYFDKYQLGKIFERTYGWAWVLKLDEELLKAGKNVNEEWHKNLQPLTSKIVQLWKEYLPKQTYPNRTGVHNNSAFALGFALDWARTVGDKEFETMIIEKSLSFYFNDSDIPAYLEPDGADFFSPSLQVADLMTRILNDEEYEKWFDKYFGPKGLKRVMEDLVVSDRSDYQISHLDGLMFSRAWNMKTIIKKLPETHSISKPFQEASDRFLKEAMNHLNQGNYSGDHWLASFAVYALTN